MVTFWVHYQTHFSAVLLYPLYGAEVKTGQKTKSEEVADSFLIHPKKKKMADKARKTVNFR